MVDATKACESDFVSPDLVKRSTAKKVVFLDAGKYIMGKFGEQLQFNVEIDGKKKVYSPNRETSNNIAEVYGMDTEKWVGQVICLSLVQLATGKLSILGMPTLRELKQVNVPDGVELTQ